MVNVLTRIGKLPAQSSLRCDTDRGTQVVGANRVVYLCFLCGLLFKTASQVPLKLSGRIGAVSEDLPEQHDRRRGEHDAGEN